MRDLSSLCEFTCIIYWSLSPDEHFTFLLGSSLFWYQLIHGHIKKKDWEGARRGQRVRSTWDVYSLVMTETFISLLFFLYWANDIFDLSVPHTNIWTFSLFSMFIKCLLVLTVISGFSILVWAFGWQILRQTCCMFSVMIRVGNKHFANAQFCAIFVSNLTSNLDFY